MISNAPAPEWKQEQLDSLEIRRAESRLQQSVHRGDFTTPYTFKSRRRGHTPIKLRTFAKGGNREAVGSDFSNGISIVFVSRRYHACFVRLPYNSVRILSDAADSEGETPGIGSFIDELRPIACATVPGNRQIVRIAGGADGDLLHEFQRGAPNRCRITELVKPRSPLRISQNTDLFTRSVHFRETRSRIGIPSFHRTLRIDVEPHALCRIRFDIVPVNFKGAIRGMRYPAGQGSKALFESRTVAAPTASFSK